MVVLLDLLTTTQPHMIPRSESTDLERWEERSKPLVPVDHTRKGDGNQLPLRPLSVTPGLGRSHIVPSTPIAESSFLNPSLDWRADSIERTRGYSSGISPQPSAQLAAVEGDAQLSPSRGSEEGGKPLFSYPLYYYMNDTSPVDDSSLDRPYQGRVVLRRKPPTAEAPVPQQAPTQSPTQLYHALPPPVGAAAEALPLRHFDLDYSFENEAYLSELSLEGSCSEPYATPCETPTIQRLSICSTDVSFHTARDEVTTGSEATSHTCSPIKHGPQVQEDNSSLHHHHQPLQTSLTRCWSANSAAANVPPPRGDRQWYNSKRSSAPVFSPTEKVAPDKNDGGFNRRATYHESAIPHVLGAGSRPLSISEVTSRDRLAQLCKEIYGDGDELYPDCRHSRSEHQIAKLTADPRHHRTNGTIGPTRKEQKSSKPERGLKYNASHGHLPSFPTISENVHTKDSLLRNSSGRAGYLGKRKQLGSQGTDKVILTGEKLTQHSQIYHSAELYPFIATPVSSLSGAHSMDSYHNYLTYSKVPGSTIWSVPAKASDTVYRVPELKLGRSTYV